jgi:hypothetical protein
MSATLAPETEATVRSAIAAMDDVIAEAEHYGNAIQYPLKVMRAHMQAQQRLFVDAALTIEAAAARAADPLTKDQIAQLAYEMASKSHDAVTRLIMAENRKWLTYGILGGVALAVVLAVGSYFYGRSETRTAMAAMPGVQAGFDAATAQQWLAIMQNNPGIRSVLANCKPYDGGQGNRQACTIALWLEPPKPANPN